MGSPYRNSIYQVLLEIDALFISEFELLTPFKYDDVLPGERYGILSFEEFDRDTRLNATDVFKVIRGDLILVFGYDNEQSAKIQPAQIMLDLDNFVGVCKEKLPSGYNVLYDFVLESSITRSLRQPLNDPDLWIAVLTATVAARIALPKTKTGSHRG